MDDEAQEACRGIAYLGSVEKSVIRMGAISMIMALGVYGLPLLLDQSLRAASVGLCRTGPLVTSDRMFFLATAGVMLCIVILPVIGFVLGMLGIYRQKHEVELSCVASVMHGTLLATLFLMVQSSADVYAYLNIFQLAMGTRIV